MPNPNALLRDGERLDDLQLAGNFIISHPDKYCFSSDSVMLANMVKANSKSKVVDLCCGGGIIAILIALKTNCNNILGVELQPDMSDMAERSVKINNLENRVNILCEDVRNITNVIPTGSVDVVVCNPPYYKLGSGEIRESRAVAIARHEIMLDLQTLVQCTAKILKFGGLFYMVHKAERMAEVLTTLTQSNLIPKQIFTICTGASNVADTFIVVSKLGAKHGVVVKNIRHD